MPDAVHRPGVRCRHLELSRRQPDADRGRLPSVTHTFAAGGSYEIGVGITNAKGASARDFELTVGNATPTTLTVTLPTGATEASGSVAINLTRSGKLDVPTEAAYRMYKFRGPDRITPVQGTVTFAAGDAQRVLSFPMTNPDTVWMGPTAYYFAIESLDATLLAGLPKVPGYPTEVSGQFEIVDDDARPRLRLQDATVIEGDAGITMATIRATLDVPSGLHHAFSVTMLDGFEEVQSLGLASFHFAPGQLAADAVIMLKSDRVPEPDEAFTFIVNGGGSTNPEWPIMDRPWGTLTILNDDIGFSYPKLWMNAGESLTIPFDLGTPLSTNASLTFTPDNPAVVALTPSAAGSTGTLKIDALRGGDAIVTARVAGPTSNASGELYINVFQPATLVARPAAVKMHAGDELTLHVTFAPAQGITALVTVQPEPGGIVAVLDTPAWAPAGGEAVVRLRGIAVGKTVLTVHSPGQPAVTSVPVEVVAGSGRRRATKP